MDRAVVTKHDHDLPMSLKAIQQVKVGADVSMHYDPMISKLAVQG